MGTFVHSVFAAYMQRTHHRSIVNCAWVFAVTMSDMDFCHLCSSLIAALINCIFHRFKHHFCLPFQMRPCVPHKRLILSVHRWRNRLAYIVECMPIHRKSNLNGYFRIAMNVWSRPHRMDSTILRRMAPMDLWVSVVGLQP